MKNKTLLTLCAAPLLLSINAMADGGGAVTLNGDDLSAPIVINENYDGEYAFSGWDDSQIHSYSVTYNRSFTENVPATIVLPFDMPSGFSTNAYFYTLQYVIPDFREGNRTWLAKMQKIETSTVKAHKPYAVIVYNGDKIIFNNDWDHEVKVKAPSNGDLSNNKTFNVNYSSIGDGNELDLSYTVTDNANDWYFVGTYENGTWSDGDGEVGLCYGFEGSSESETPKGHFGKIANGTVKKAFRSYLCKKDNKVQLPASYIKQNGGAAKSASVFSLPETINVEFVDTDANGKEHTTYVGKLNRIDNVRLNRERSTFDLKGRNVDGKRTAKGVYLKK